jgi:hypothetical protein
MPRALVATLFLLTAVRASAEEVRHRFLAVDESRDKLHFVDQVDPSKDWTLDLPSKHRDLQLVGQNHVLLTWPEGYSEFSLSDRKMTKQVKGFPGATSVRRLSDGRTILACNRDGVTFFDLDPQDKPLRKVSFPAKTTRLFRLTPQGTLLFGCANEVYEGSWDGKFTKITLKPGVWVYQAVRLPNGHLLAAGGYDPAMYEVDGQGGVVKSIAGKQTAEGASLGYHFFGGFQLLPSGDLVISNWTGHAPKDSDKGVQIVQYNPAGQLVWKWHDPARAGSINGIIVLDNLDPELLHDDAASVLGPVR